MFLVAGWASFLFCFCNLFNFESQLIERWVSLLAKDNLKSPTNKNDFYAIGFQLYHNFNLVLLTHFM